MRNIFLTPDEAAAVQARRNKERPDFGRYLGTDPKKIIPLTEGEYAFILRRRAGLSLREVADRLGVSAVTVGNRERGVKGDPQTLIDLLEPEVNDAIHFHTNPHPTAK